MGSYVGLFFFLLILPFVFFVQMTWSGVVFDGIIAGKILLTHWQTQAVSPGMNMYLCSGFRNRQNLAWLCETAKISTCKIVMLPKSQNVVLVIRELSTDRSSATQNKTKQMQQLTFSEGNKGSSWPLRSLPVWASDLDWSVKMTSSAVSPCNASLKFTILRTVAADRMIASERRNRTYHTQSKEQQYSKSIITDPVGFFFSFFYINFLNSMVKVQGQNSNRNTGTVKRTARSSKRILGDTDADGVAL